MLRFIRRHPWLYILPLIPIIYWLGGKVMPAPWEHFLVRIAVGSAVLIAASWLIGRLLDVATRGAGDDPETPPATPTP